MRSDRVAAALFDIPENPLETLVGEGLDPPAVVADDVVMVLHLIADRLEARDAVAEVKPLDEALLGEHLEHAVDARKPHPLPARRECSMDLLRPGAAVLRVEELDHAHPGNASPVAGGPEPGERPLRPGRVGSDHRKMIIVSLSMRIVRVLLALVLGAAALAGCGSTSSAKGKETVVAAFYPLAFAAERIGGKKVDVHNLTPPGAEPHDIELTPGDVARLERADVVLYLSHGFQPAVEEAVGDAQGKRVDVFAGIGLRRGVGDEAGKSDPHVWLDPVLFARVVKRIGAALGEPARAKTLAGRVLALDGEYRSGLAHCARREFVTSHAAFGYLAARYHLRQIAITGIDPESEPSPRRLHELIDLVRREHVTTVFFERLVSPRLAETVARDAGVKAAVLDPIEGLTPSEQARGADYFTLMSQNLDELRSALGCR